MQAVIAEQECPSLSEILEAKLTIYLIPPTHASLELHLRVSKLQSLDTHQEVRINFTTVKILALKTAISVSRRYGLDVKEPAEGSACQ